MRGLCLAFCSLCLLASGGPVGAQESTFGLQFLGVSEETGDGRARSMGLLGVALDDERSAIVLNPAMLGSTGFMTLSAMAVTGVRRSKSPDFNERRGMTRLPHQRLALPLFSKVVLTTGFSSSRNVKSGFTLGPRSLEGIAYEQFFEREGTLFQLPLGLAGAFGDRVKLGATLDFWLGTLDDHWTTTGDSLVALRTRRSDTMTGRTLTLGLQFKPLPWLTLGSTYSPEFTMNQSSKTVVEDSRVISGTTPIREDVERSDVRFPQAWRGGVSFEARPDLIVAADMVWRNWEAYDGRLYGADAVRNETRWGVGLELRRGQRLYYRTGFSRTAWPQVVGGNELNENTFHLGLGLDLSADSGRFDIGLEFSNVGDMADNGREDSSWRVFMSLSGQEIWKRRSPETRP